MLLEILPTLVKQPFINVNKLWRYRTLSDVQKRIPYFIEDVYNQKRPYYSLVGQGYLRLRQE